MNIKRLQTLRIAKGYHLLPVKPGMQLEIHEKVGEGNNKRIWKFRGLVIKVYKPNHADGTFTIRGKTAGHTIEKIYPLSFPHFAKVILLDTYKIRRAKLYYIREKIGKDARMKSILSKEEKQVDLLSLALKEIEALQKAYEEEEKEEEKVEEVKEGEEVTGEEKGEEEKEVEEVKEEKKVTEGEEVTEEKEVKEEEEEKEEKEEEKVEEVKEGEEVTEEKEGGEEEK